MTDSRDRTIFLFFFVTIAVFVIGRLAGYVLPADNWAFSHIRYIPYLYLLSWLLLAGLAGWIVIKTSLIEKVSDVRYANPIMAGAFLLFFILFSYDGFVFGGGNHFIRDTIQQGTVIFHWYEPLSLGLFSVISSILSALLSDNLSAGIMSWRIISWLGGLAAIIGCWQLTTVLTEKQVHRLYLFTVMFFGPQLLMFFGYIGTETILPAVAYWFTYTLLLVLKSFSFVKLARLWLLFFIGLALHISSIIFLPALLYGSFIHLFNNNSRLPVIIGLLAWIGLLIATFVSAANQLSIAREILQLNGPDTLQNYHLFSGGHLLDFLLLLVVAYPAIILMIGLSSKVRLLSSPDVAAVLLMVLSGVTALFVIDPVHGIPLDFPRLAVMLTPLPIFIGVGLSKIIKATNLIKPIVLFAAVSATCILPVYVSIDASDAYLEAYVKEHPHYYFETATALQDSHFNIGDKERANYWFVGLPKFSPAFLDFTAAVELTDGGIYSEAIGKLQTIITKYPFWTEPRRLLATIHLTRQHYQPAKTVIDSCLMMEPYHKEHLELLYRYYRDIKMYDRAIETADQALRLYPDELRFAEDKVIALYRSGNFPLADREASVLIDQDSTLAYAHLVKGLIAEYNTDTARAIQSLERFIKLAPDEAETPMIRKRLNNLIINQ